ncbi:MAG: cell division protein FtsQ/DivIB [Steroidobacteraceae bacterium]
MLKRARNRMKSRGQSPTRSRIPWGAIGRALTTGAAAFATLCVVFWALDQPIRTVEVTGRFQHVLPGEIEQVVATQVHGEGLLTVRLAAVSRAIQALPWVAAVSVERDWPHALAVQVVEQVAAARWDGDGLLNSEGELFATGVSHFPAGVSRGPSSPGGGTQLARLSGPQGSEAEVTQRYLAMQRRLSEAGLSMIALRLDARGAWQLELANGITVRLGRAQVDERFDKFMSAALGIIERRAGDISYVDMRYTNGFAIGWKSGHGTGEDRHA